MYNFQSHQPVSAFTKYTTNSHIAISCSQMSKWWHLPTDIVDHVLEHISFPDFVALTQTNSALRHLLDNTRMLQLVLSANFAELIDSFEWSFTDLDECLQKQNLWKSYLELDSFLKFRDSPIVDFSSPPSNYKRLLEEIHKLTTSERFFIPLVIIYYELAANLKSGLITKKPRISISRFSWAQLLMHLQNVQRAVLFFHNVGNEIPLLIEKAFFEFSRSDLNFPQLAKSRTKALYNIRKQVRQFLPVSNGIIIFPDWPSFFQFLKELVMVVVKALPKAKGQYHAMNILRAYDGDGIAGKDMNMAIIAKILTEEVFKKLRIKVSHQLVKLSVRPSAVMIWVGPIEVQIVTDPPDVRVFTQRVDTNNLQLPLVPLNVPRLLKNIDTSDRHCGDSLSYDFPWKPAGRRRKFFVDIFSESMKSNSLTHLTSCDDDLLSFFYYSSIMGTAGMEGPCADFFARCFNLLRSSEESITAKYKLGQLVINLHLGYMGTIVLVQNESKVYSLLPHDFTRFCVAQEPSLTQLDLKQAGNILPWLTQSEGFILSGVCLFSCIEVQDKNIIFSNRAAKG